MTEKTYKYYHEGVGYNNKRDLSRGISASFLSAYGKQIMEQVIERGINNVVSVVGLGPEEANKKIFIGFIHNDLTHPNPNLSDVISTRAGDNFIYLVAYTFGIGGTPITQATEKISDKHLKGETLTLSTPVEAEPLTEESNKEEAEKVSTTPDSLRDISEDFRARD